MNLCGAVKVFGVGLVGQKLLICFPRLDDSSRLTQLVESGGVIEPKWLDFGVLSREDQRE